MDSDLETLATSLYVTVDDLLIDHPEQLPQRPEVGIAPLISDAELIVLSVLQALLGYRSETRWLRRAHKDFHSMFPVPSPPVGVQQTVAETRRYDGLVDWATRLLDRRGHR